MVLTRSDLQAIKKIVKTETDPVKTEVKKLNKKIDDHIKFIDNDLSYFRKKTAKHLGIPVSNLMQSTKSPTS